MKRLYLCFVLAVLGVCSVSAQDWYVGGSLGLKVYSDSNEGEEQCWFSLNPEVGYNLSDKWAVGTRLKFSSTGYKGGDFSLMHVGVSFGLEIYHSSAMSGLNMNPQVQVIQK